MVCARTPSPPATPIRTPSAPRFGYLDNYCPYPRAGPANIALADEKKPSISRTPSPPSSPALPASEPDTPSCVSKEPLAHTLARTTSPVQTPQKKRHGASAEVVCATGEDDLGTAQEQAANLDASKEDADDSQNVQVDKIPRAGAPGVFMLPTPAKTPQKPPTDETCLRIDHFARKLFSAPGEKTRESRRRRPVKYELAATSNESFEIFTDQEPVPTMDFSSENPFLGKKTSLEPVKRKGQGTLVSFGDEAAQTFDDAATRRDGMIYMFRGKKIFRKFPERENRAPGRTGEVGDAQAVGFKPRLLFPEKKKERNEEVEEALTEVESLSDEETEPKTPVKGDSKREKTPVGPKVMPMTPPSTKRTTRSTNKLGSKSRTRGRVPGRSSPFDSWQRTKELKPCTEKRPSSSGIASPSMKRACARVEKQETPDA